MQKSLVYVDIASKSQIDVAGKFVTKSSDYVTIERGQWQVLCVQFMSRDVDEFGVVTLTPAPLPSDASLLFVADNDFVDSNTEGESDPLMLKSYQSVIPFSESDPSSNRFNIEGDWIDGTTADVAQGQISIRINSDTEKFQKVLGSRKTLTNGLYLNIKQYTTEVSNPSSIAWLPFVALNTIRDWSKPEEVPPEGTSIVPFINAFLKNPFEFQFSVDGATDWHTTQTESDMYFRQRIANIDGEWSPAIMLVRGAQGEDGADGADGYTPVKGTDYWTDADKQEIKEYVDSAILNGEW